jgi:vacuolar-type H+-ATPase subunit H
MPAASPFSEAQLTVLQDLLEEFREAGREGREEIRKQAVAKVRTLCTSDKPLKKAEVKKVCISPDDNQYRIE